MELRWNNARPDAESEGKKAKPNPSHSGQGLEIKETFPTSGRGRKMSLTSPLIDQAIALTTWTVSDSGKMTGNPEVIRFQFLLCRRSLKIAACGPSLPAHPATPSPHERQTKRR